MAKSETVAIVTDEIDNVIPFDQEEILNEVIGNLGEATEVVGTWKFQFIHGDVRGGTSAKGSWKRLSLMLVPIEPQGEHDYTKEELTDLDPVYHGMFYTTVKNKRDFVKWARLFGVDMPEDATLGETFVDLKGEYVIATAKPGTDNRGQPETKLSNFRPVVDEDE